MILGHIVNWGFFSDQSTWDELDELLRTGWRHPYGGMLKIDAALVHAGTDHYESVMAFCLPKRGRKIFPSKGIDGARPAFASSKGKKIADKLVLVGVDTLKNLIFSKLQLARGIQFSNTLEPVYYEQLASERRVIRYSKGQPKRRFERLSSRARAEALDALVYATAARSAANVSWDKREAESFG